MSKFITITREQMEDTLGVIKDPAQAKVGVPGWMPVTLPGVRELVWGKRVTGKVPTTIRVYSSIEPNGVGRDCGKDAIRVQVFCRVEGADGQPRIVRVGTSKRVNRVPGWEGRLMDRIEAWEGLLGPSCPSCGMPTVERKGPKGKFYGCCRFPDCRGTVKKNS